VSRCVLVHDFDVNHLWDRVRLLEGVAGLAAQRAAVPIPPVDGVATRSELLDRIAANDPSEPSIVVVDLRRDDLDLVYQGARIAETILWHGTLRPRAHVVVLTAWASPEIMRLFAQLSVRGLRISGFVGHRHLVRHGSPATVELIADLLGRRVTPGRPTFVVEDDDLVDHRSELDAAIARLGPTPSPALYELLEAWAENLVTHAELQHRLSSRGLMAPASVRGFLERVEEKLDARPDVPRRSDGSINGPRLALDLFARHPPPEMGHVRAEDLPVPTQVHRLMADNDVRRCAWLDEMAAETLEAVLVRGLPTGTPDSWRRAAALAFQAEAQQRGQAIIRALLALRACATELA
jgi:hypothetical protein